MAHLINHFSYFDIKVGMRRRILDFPFQFLILILIFFYFSYNNNKNSLYGSASSVLILTGSGCRYLPLGGRGARVTTDVRQGSTRGREALSVGAVTRRRSVLRPPPNKQLLPADHRAKPLGAIVLFFGWVFVCLLSLFPLFIFNSACVRVHQCFLVTNIGFMMCCHQSQLK